MQDNSGTKIESIKLVNAESLSESVRRLLNLPDIGFVEIFIERNSDPEPKRGLPYTFEVFRQSREILKSEGILGKKLSEL